MVSRLGYCILVTRDSIQRTRLWLSRGGNFDPLPKISLYLIYLFLLYCDLYCAYQAACTLLRVYGALLRAYGALLRVYDALLRVYKPSLVLIQGSQEPLWLFQGFQYYSMTFHNT
jgi:hypothetical protein